MPFCIRCSPVTCDGVGIISVNITSNSSARPTDDDDCSTGTSTGGVVTNSIDSLGNTVSSTAADYIPGPSVGNISISAYAFFSGQDKWLGSRCKGSASASQSNIQRYDNTTNKYWFIPTKIHKAQIAGDIHEVTLGKIFYQGSIFDSQIVNGTTISTEMGIQLGAEFTYNGPPVPVTIPDLNPWIITIGSNVIQGAFLSSVNLNVDYPQPATISYTFEFPLADNGGFAVVT